MQIYKNYLSKKIYQRWNERMGKNFAKRKNMREGRKDYGNST